MFLRRALPGHHLDDDAKDVVRLGTGLIGTIAALVLGLIIASAKSSYDTQSSQVQYMTDRAILATVCSSINWPAHKAGHSFSCGDSSAGLKSRQALRPARQGLPTARGGQGRDHMTRL